MKSEFIKSAFLGGNNQHLCFGVYMLRAPNESLLLIARKKITLGNSLSL